jgi:O-antigen ligase
VLSVARPQSIVNKGKGSLCDTILGSASTQHFATLLLEMGIPGLILSLLIMLRLPKGLAKLYKAPAAAKDKALICGLYGTSVIMIAYVFYMPVLFYAESTAYLFWLSAAYLSVSANEMREQHAS